MSEMVERVAAAIAPLIDDDCGCYPECGGRTIARAAIAAMREPTMAMVRDGNDAQTINEDGNVLQIPMDAGIPWRAMIDAALKE